MKNKELHRCHPSGSQFEYQTRAAQAKLRIVLARVQSNPGNGELSATLQKMLDAGQIVYEPVRQDDGFELVFAPRVTPGEIRELLPQVRHPLTQALLRFFLERVFYIPQITGAAGQ